MKDEMETEEVKAREALVKATEAYETVHTAYRAAKALYEAAWSELTATPEWAEVRKRDAEYVVAKNEADAALLKVKAVAGVNLIQSGRVS